MLSDALVLAILSSIGLAMLYLKCPDKIRSFLCKHPIFTDFLTFGLTYFSLGSSLTALTAGAMVAIMTSSLMYIEEHREDFLYLFDLKNFITSNLKQLKVWLTEIGESYRNKQIEG